MKRFADSRRAAAHAMSQVRAASAGVGQRAESTKARAARQRRDSRVETDRAPRGPARKPAPPRPGPKGSGMPRRGPDIPRGGGPRGGGGGRPPGRPPRRSPGPAPANSRRRVRVVFLAVLFCFTLFAAQLVRLQGIDAAQVAEKARDLRTGRATILPAQRGELLDREGVVLAGSVERRDIIADQLAVKEYEVRDPATKKWQPAGAAGAAKALAPILGTDAATLQPKLTGDSRYVQLARRLEPGDWRRIEALKIPGITSEANPIRTYPGGAPLAPVLGWVGADGQAKDGSGGGLELLYDDQLTGTPGSSLRERSADNRVIPMGYSEVTPAVPGKDLKLSLDNDLSWYAYNAIVDQVKKAEADSGTVVVMDTKGRLRAVSQFPSFDPEKRDAKGSQFGSLPFQHVFEPGSTAKVMSIGAALDLGVVTPTSPFSVPYTLKRGSQVFHDSHSHKEERLTTAGILAQSSNTGTIQVAERVSEADLEKYFRAFGLGERSGVGFPGESVGMLAPHEKWDGRTRYALMFGQGLSMTAIQVAGVFQTIANGGVRIPPTLVEGVRQTDGSFAPAQLPEGTRVLSEKAATDLSVMLESVVGTGGTAQQAAIAGIPVAGKTGTAERYGDNGKPDGYTASFIGFAPADKPELIVAVILDNPKKGYYGGALAGPVFHQVMSYALQKYGIPPTGVERTPFPLQVGEKPSTDRPKVDPGALDSNGVARGGAASPTPPGIAAPSDESASGSTRGGTAGAAGDGPGAGASGGNGTSGVPAR